MLTGTNTIDMRRAFIARQYAVPVKTVTPEWAEKRAQAEEQLALQLGGRNPLAQSALFQAARKYREIAQELRQAA